MNTVPWVEDTQSDFKVFGGLGDFFLKVPHIASPRVPSSSCPSGEPPTCAVPLFSPAAKIHPSVALLEAQGVSLSAESDQRTRAGAAQAFKKAWQNDSCRKV